MSKKYKNRQKSLEDSVLEFIQSGPEERIQTNKELTAFTKFGRVSSLALRRFAGFTTTINKKKEN